MNSTFLPASKTQSFRSLWVLAPHSTCMSQKGMVSTTLGVQMLWFLVQEGGWSLLVSSLLPKVQAKWHQCSVRAKILLTRVVGGGFLANETFWKVFLKNEKWMWSHWSITPNKGLTTMYTAEDGSEKVAAVFNRALKGLQAWGMQALDVRE